MGVHVVVCACSSVACCSCLAAAVAAGVHRVLYSSQYEAAKMSKVVSSQPEAADVTVVDAGWAGFV